MNSGYIIRKSIHGKPACSSDLSLKDVYKETKWFKSLPAKVYSLEFNQPFHPAAGCKDGYKGEAEDTAALAAEAGSLGLFDTPEMPVYWLMREHDRSCLELYVQLNIHAEQKLQILRS